MPAASAPHPAAGQVRDQIARLQQRQMEMVQQTALELEELKKRLEHNEETEWLRSRVSVLEEEKAMLQDSFEQQLSSLRNVIRGQARAIDQQIQIFSLDASQNLESMLGALQIEQPKRSEPPRQRQAAPIAQVVPPPVVYEPAPYEPIPYEPVQPTYADFVDMPTAYVQTEATAQPEPSQLTDIQPPKRAKRKRGIRIIPGRKMVIRMASLALIGSAGYWSWGQFIVPKTEIHGGEVAGATTIQAADDPYAASFANYPFAQTAWENHVDSDFGLSVDWPSNTSNRVRVVGGNNLWFLRKNGFLMQITRLDAGSALDIDQWWSHHKSEFEEDGTISKTTFKGQPAWYVEATGITPTSGNSYFVKRPSGIFHIWVKNEPGSTDDGQRIARMLSSFTFTN